MAPRELEQYRQQLLEQGKRLQGDLQGVQADVFRRTDGEASGSLSNMPIHPADLGTDNFQQEVAAGLLENDRPVLQQIAEALDRIDEGTYGRCQECGCAIAPERLHALTWTPHCVDCARAAQEKFGMKALGPNLT